MPHTAHATHTSVVVCDAHTHMLVPPFVGLSQTNACIGVHATSTCGGAMRMLDTVVAVSVAARK